MSDGGRDPGGPADRQWPDPQRSDQQWAGHQAAGGHGADRQWAQGPSVGAPPDPYRQDHPAPTPHHPTQQYPTQQYPTPQYPTPQYPAPPYGGGPPTWGPPPGYGGGDGAPSPKKRRWPLITAIVAVVALLAGGGAAAWALLGGSGGASTPNGVVTALAEDLEGRDYLRVYTRIAPNEATLLTDLGSVLTTELQRLDVLRPDARADASLDTVTFSGLRFDEAGAEQVRPNVTITKLVAGTITTTQDPASLPFTDSFKAKVYPNGTPPAEVPRTIDIAQVVREQGGPIRIATVQLDGEWYVSGLYTAADYALRDAAEPWPTTSVDARGAGSAQDAVRDLVQAALDADVRRVIELTDPTEMAALHEAGPALVDGAAGARPTGARIVDLRTTETDVRGHTALSLASLTVDDGAGAQVTLTRTGDCLTISGVEGAPPQLCANQLGSLVGAQVGSSPALQELTPRLATAVLNVKVVTTEDGGSWYVAPGQTVVQLYADLLGALRPGDLDALIAGN
ncbi:flagellar basal body protein FliL [Pseudonocardia sp. RS11V-5]|uniref:flagellar basal body protein FliL n=1 Tax=Pseudonocardia terrae TaxID=2905831 RepID=UPI001E2C2E78|nr:flagellar basal body protein FliL [Pseudonocardia terrae]MCE3550034.1 flagellar basal body protein FliL [Pseudonocardia terrae]